MSSISNRIERHSKKFISKYYDYKSISGSHEQNAYTVIQNSKHFNMKSNEIRHLHFHNCIELGVCVSGAGECYTEDKLYRFRSGDVQIFFPYQKHYSKSNVGETTNWYFVSFELESIKRVYEAFDLAGIEKILDEEALLSGIIYQDEFPDIAQVVTEIVMETIEPLKELSFEITCVNIEKLFLILLRHANSVNTSKFNIDRKLNLVLPALNAISSNLQNIESAKDIAKICSMSASNTRIIFNELFGISPQKYLLTKKLSRALELLPDDKLSIQEISELSGFSSMTCFYRNFKKYYEISPIQYRQKNKQIKR